MEYSRYIYTFLYFLYQIVANSGWTGCTKRHRKAATINKTPDAHLYGRRGFSAVTLPVVVCLREHRRPAGQRLGGELSFEVTIAAAHVGVRPEQRRAEDAEHHADESQHRPRQWRSSPTL